MTLVEIPRSLTPSVEIADASVQTTFERAHVSEILHDIKVSLDGNGYPSEISLQVLSSRDLQHLVEQPPVLMQFHPREEREVPVTRGVVFYKQGREMKGIGFDAFPDGSVRAIAGRQNEDGVFDWMLLKNLPKEEKVRPFGTKKDLETGRETTIYQHVGDTVVHIGEGGPEYGRLAQALLGTHVRALLPEGVSLPDYANKYLPASNTKK